MIMRAIQIVALAAVLLLSAVGAQAQNVLKVGYTNIEFLLESWQDAIKAREQLAVYKNQLETSLKAKEDYYNLKIQEYMEWKQSSLYAAAQDSGKVKEIMKLEKELSLALDEAQNQLVSKEDALLGPLLDKMQDQIQLVSKELGYAFVLNKTNSDGVANILYAAPGLDITETVAAKLGITLPKQ